MERQGAEEKSDSCGMYARQTESPHESRQKSLEQRALERGILLLQLQQLCLLLRGQADQRNVGISRCLHTRRQSWAGRLSMDSCNAMSIHWARAAAFAC